VDIGKAFSFVFDDEGWVSKVLIGGLIALIPIVGTFVVSGYGYKVAQNVARGVERPLPDWSEFGDALMRGLIGFVISLVYTLPVALLGIVLAVITAGAAAAAGDERGGAAVGGLFVCLVPIMIILGLICGAAALAAVARYLATDDFGQAFKFGEVLASLRNNLGAWVMLLLVAILAGFVASLGIIACGIGVLFTSFYAQAVIGHALGQTIRQLGLGQYSAPPSSYGPPPTYS
jgi:hypothetical protein